LRREAKENTMKTNVTKSDFTAAFANSEERKGQFSYGALCALYDYLTDYEESCDAEVDFDMIALCCEYTEYANATEALDCYDLHDEDRDDLENLRDHTTVIEFDGGIVIADF
jgi:hypothetical protein